MEQEFINKFKEALEINDQVITLDTRFRDLEDWSSLAFLSILAMIDEEYDVVIEGNDFRDLVTIEDLIKEIRKQKA
ncbi:MAG TPA: acyl carrier protein [Bacteroidales bacterium]|jgi:acyl carrier protein|nr:acyl carrier protein [Bacteroidales bacterium]